VRVPRESIDAARADAAHDVAVVHARTLPRALASYAAPNPRVGATPAKKVAHTPAWARRPRVTGGPLYASEWYPDWWTGC